MQIWEEVRKIEDTRAKALSIASNNEQELLAIQLAFKGVEQFAADFETKLFSLAANTVELSRVSGSKEYY
jgi:hypothetical protein